MRKFVALTVLLIALPPSPPPVEVRQEISTPPAIDTIVEIAAEHAVQVEAERTADVQGDEAMLTLDETVFFAHIEADRLQEEHRAALEYLNAIELERQRQEAEAARRAEEERRRQAQPQRSSAPATYGSGACGGDLPPCYVMMRESRGNITAQNPTSTASGKWQFLDSTWGGYGGYAKARHAPESVQDERARQLWNGGRGCSHWRACG